MTATDITPRHIDYINNKLKGSSYHISTCVQDATDLSRYKDGIFDVVLCMGPFYHFLFKSDCQFLQAVDTSAILNDSVAFPFKNPRQLARVDFNLFAVFHRQVHAPAVAVIVFKCKLRWNPVTNIFQPVLACVIPDLALFSLSSSDGSPNRRAYDKSVEPLSPSTSFNSSSDILEDN